MKLTDDQLRQVAAHIATFDAHAAATDLPADSVDHALLALGIDTTTADLDRADEGTLDRVAKLIETATVTVDWPEEPVRAFAAKLRGELEQLRESHERQGLYPAALAYTGAVASLDAALADLDSEAAK